MKTQDFAIIAVLTCAGVESVSAQCDDPFDQTLCAYWEAQADQQFAVDGALSSFWGTWGTRDQIEMTAPQFCYAGRCGFTGADDASTTIKAVASSAGLYLLATVQDNVWTDRTSVEDWGADAMDLYIDALDANQVFSCTDCHIGLYASSLTFSSKQFQVWMGATALPEGFRYSYYDEVGWTWTSIPLTWAEAKTRFGYAVDVVAVDATTKVQEWFFPWRTIDPAATGGMGERRLAFSGGYNDKDGDNPDPDCLRWLLKDPWAEDALTTNYWGEIVLPTSSVVKPARAGRAAAQPGGNVRGFYTLGGRRIDAGSTVGRPASGLVVADRGGTGRILTEMGALR